MVKEILTYFATGEDRTANSVYAIAGTQDAAAVSTPRDPSSSINTPRDFRLPFTRELVNTLASNTFHWDILAVLLTLDYYFLIIMFS